MSSHVFFPVFSRSHAHSSILRYPCTTDDAPVELHCDPEPWPPRPACLHGAPSAASTLSTGRRAFDRPSRSLDRRAWLPRTPVTRLRYFNTPRLERDGPVLIHNSPVSSSGINVSRLNTFTTPGHTSLCEVQHTLRSFATLTLAFTSRTTTNSRFAIGWSGQEISTPRSI
jgi:hypothetical protein